MPDAEVDRLMSSDPTGANDGPVLFCYDGSPGSRSALAQVSGVLAPRSAVVLSVWEPILLRLGASSYAAMTYLPDSGQLDEREKAGATQAAQQGATALGQVGWDAVPRIETATTGTWRTILDTADDVDASLIVLGARGLTAIHRSLLGSVSEAILHHSRRPALIAHQPEAAGSGS